MGGTSSPPWTYKLCVQKWKTHFWVIVIESFTLEKKVSVDFLLCQMQVIAENFWKIFSVELFGP